MRRAARRIARAGLAVLVAAALVAAPCGPAAQPDTRIQWIGYLANEPTPDSAPVLREALRKRDWIEGQSIKIWYRYVQGKPELYQQHAEDLVGLKVAVIVAVGPQAIQAARQATKTVPIVVVTIDDPVAAGLVAKPATGATNVAGLTTFAPELSARRLDLLREVVPTLARAVVLWSSTSATGAEDLRAIQDAAKARGVTLTPVEIAGETEIREALGQIGQSRPQGLLVLSDAITLAHRQRLATFASRGKLPAVYPSRDFADAGGLIAYGANWTDVFQQTGELVDRILRGAKPAELGIRRASRYELVVNLRAARALSLKISSSLLRRADRIIE